MAHVVDVVDVGMPYASAFSFHRSFIDQPRICLTLVLYARGIVVGVQPRVRLTFVLWGRGVVVRDLALFIFWKLVPIILVFTILGNTALLFSTTAGTLSFVFFIIVSVVENITNSFVYLAVIIIFFLIYFLTF